MTTTCPECGAVWPTDEANCETTFGEYLALDFYNPDYGAVHFLNVSTFMLQHGRYSEAGLAWVVPTMRAYLAGEIDAARIRQQSGAGLQQGQRQWKVTRRPTDPPQRRVAWSMTLADVAAQVTDAASYRAAMTAWAQAAVADWEAGAP
jgi:hypothetical protein